MQPNGKPYMMNCRICSAEVSLLVNLGTFPPANSLKKSPEQFQESYPLVLDICKSCGNVQLRSCLDEEALYKDYFYVTPSSTILSHHYESLQSFLFRNSYLKRNSFVLEIGSNIGHFLDYIKPRVAKVLGIDPATNICKLANQRGVHTVCEFFNYESSVQLKKTFYPPDIIVARHCLAHNYNPHSILDGVTNLLDRSGFFIIENAYLLNTIKNNEFDQIYHEHMFYYSIRSMKALLALHGMHIVNILMSPVHGGSIIFVTKKIAPNDRISQAVEKYTERENIFLTKSAFKRFVDNTFEFKKKLSKLLTDLRAAGQKIYSYGATAKGNTLLNFMGLTSKEIQYCVDNTLSKQGRYLPQSNIKIISEEESQKQPPDYFLLTAWNYKDEIVTKVRQAGNYTSLFIVPIPFVHLL
ncbi:MAG: methyltransferase domain-containing protein [Xenococcaceae cyanobacterium]